MRGKKLTMLNSTLYREREARMRHFREMFTEIALILALGVGVLLLVATVCWFLAWLIFGV